MSARFGTLEVRTSSSACTVYGSNLFFDIIEYTYNSFRFSLRYYYITPLNYSHNRIHFPLLE